MLPSREPARYDFLITYTYEELVAVANLALGMAAADVLVPYDRRIQELVDLEHWLHSLAWSLSHRQLDEARRTIRLVIDD